MPDWFPPLYDLTLREQYLLLFGSAGAVGLVFGMIGAWFGARSGARRGARRALREASRVIDADVREQVSELSRSLDVVALEMERVSEAQRYVARLLAQRAQAELARDELRRADPRLAEQRLAEPPNPLTPSDPLRGMRHVTPH